jgi:hypothetical protein
MTETLDLTLDNFTDRTGSRFRVSKEQAARIALTDLSDEDRNALVGLSVDEAADRLGARGLKGKPLNWVEEALELLAHGWSDSMALSREGAFQEFLADGGLDKLEKRPPAIPDELYLDPELTVDNFPEKVEALIGRKRRFRVSREQHQRIKAGTLSREGALAETVAEIVAKRTEQQ